MNPDDIIQVELVHTATGEKENKAIKRADLEARLAKAKEFGWKVVNQIDTSLPAKSADEQKKRDDAARAAAVSEARLAVTKDVGSAPRSFVSGVFDGLSSNWLDEAVGVASPELKERMRRNIDVQKSESPNAYTAGQMAGSVGQQLGLTRLIPGMKSPAGQLAYSGIEGAISAIGQEEDITPESAAIVGASGAGGGVIGQLGGTALGRAGSGIIKKIVGQTGLETAKEIEERLGREMLAKQLAEMNALKATAGQVQRNALKDVRTVVGAPSPSQAAMEFAKQIAENKKIEQELIANFQKNYPEQFSKGGAFGSAIGSQAEDLQSYQNMLNEKLGAGNAAIDAANKAMAGAIDVTIPNTEAPIPVDNRSVVQKAIDRLIEMNAAKKASTSNADLTAIAERLGRE